MKLTELMGLDPGKAITEAPGDAPAEGALPGVPGGDAGGPGMDPMGGGAPPPPPMGEMGG